MQELSREDRLRLLRFVCSFAWTDLEVNDEERDFVRRLVDRFDLSEEDRVRVGQWLERPPAPDEVDPADVPISHRELFLHMARSVVATDGRLEPGERDSLAIFEELLR
jgi:hypothetical protein